MLKMTAHAFTTVSWQSMVFSVLILVCTFSGCQGGTARNESALPPNVVIDPASGQYVIKNELVILASGQDIEEIILAFEGKIVESVPETDSYQVRFPVDSLDELNGIAKTLEETYGIQVIHATVFIPQSVQR